VLVQLMTPLSTLVRQAIEQMQQRESTPAQRALALVGAFESDRSDVSVRHDDYFTAGVQAGGERSHP
jgi:hypothetical protein